MILTKRQKEILDFLRDYTARHGYAPTLNEIGRRFELSSLATVHKHLENLADKRFIRRKWNRSRALEIVVPVRRKPSVVELPLLAGKTGHTRDAGWSQAAAAQRGDTTVYGTVLGSNSRSAGTRTSP